MKHEVDLVLGTNLGNKEENLAKAMFYIENEIGEIIQKTQAKETLPWGYMSANNFLNMIIKVKTPIGPIELLKTIKKIEKKIGRGEKIDEKKYEDRVIDIDILHFQKIKFISKKLILPHAKINERDFFSFIFYRS